MAGITIRPIMSLPELAGTAHDGLTVSLRPCLPSDEPFLINLFQDSHLSELTSAGFPQEQLTALVRMQFMAQRADYRRNFPGSDWSIIMHGDRSVGMTWIGSNEEAWCVADMCVHPATRSSGVGTIVLRHVFAYAHAAGKPVRASALRTNEGSIRLLLRMGFQVTTEDDFYIHFEAPCN